MKIAIGSDIHLEFGPLVINNNESADVLVLGGDICVAASFNDTIADFFKNASELFPEVIYIMGNHEHYNGDFAVSESVLREHLSKYKNIHFLENQTVEIGDVTFIGGTMWTSMNRRDVVTMMHTKSRMNDFRTVKNSARSVTRKIPLYQRYSDGKFITNESGQYIIERYSFKTEPATFSPEDSADEFDRFFDYLNIVVEGKHDQKFFVCSHHAPSHLSVAEEYVHDTLMNGAFASRLEEWILYHPQIKIWAHGHMHNESDYTIGDTRIVCNPRGYIGHETRADNFKLKVVEI